MPCKFEYGLMTQKMIWTKGNKWNLLSYWVSVYYYFAYKNFSLFLTWCSDDHGFSPLHWCCKEGHAKLAELLVGRGARINATNRGDDTPLHLAAAHGHKDIVQLVY